MELWFVQWSFFLLRFLCISINISHGLAWTSSSSFAASLEFLVLRWNVARLSLFYMYYFGRCLGGLLVILIDYMIFLSPFLDVSKMAMSTRLWNSLSIEYFPLTYDLNDFKSRTNRYPWTVASPKQIFSMRYVLYFFFLLLHVS